MQKSKQQQASDRMKQPCSVISIFKWEQLRMTAAWLVQFFLRISAVFSSLCHMILTVHPSCIYFEYLSCQGEVSETQLMSADKICVHLSCVCFHAVMITLLCGINMCLSDYMYDITLQTPHRNRLVFLHIKHLYSIISSPLSTSKYVIK